MQVNVNVYSTEHLDREKLIRKLSRQWTRIRMVVLGLELFPPRGKDNKLKLFDRINPKPLRLVNLNMVCNGFENEKIFDGSDNQDGRIDEGEIKVDRIPTCTSQASSQLGAGSTNVKTQSIGGSQGQRDEFLGRSNSGNDTSAS